MYSKPIIFFIFYLSILNSVKVKAVDSVLVRIDSSFNYYNVYQSEHADSVFCTTKNGAFYLVNGKPLITELTSNLKRLNVRMSSITAETVFPESKEFSFLKRFVPSLEVQQPITIAATAKHLYYTYKGQLFVFELRPYKRILNDLNVSSTINSLIGTSKGLYFYEKQLEGITDSILSVASSAFFSVALTSGMELLLTDDMQVWQRYSLSDFVALSQSKDFSVDLFIVSPDEFLFLCGDGLFNINRRTLDCFPVMTFPSTAQVKEKPYFIGSIDNLVLFYHEATMYSYHIGFMCKVHKALPPTSRVKLLSDFEIGILYEGALDVLDVFGNTNKIRLPSGNYTDFLVLSDSLFLLTTGKGLFMYDLGKKGLQPVLPNAIQINSLSKDSTAILVGTSNGLISFSENAIPAITTFFEETKYPFKSLLSTSLFIMVYVVFTIFVLFLLLRWRRLIATRKRKAILDNIEAFVNSNLSQASVSAIENYLNLNTAALYKITYPEKPGKLIHRLRNRKIQELLFANQSIETIAAQTGFSVPHVRRLIQENKNGDNL